VRFRRNPGAAEVTGELVNSMLELPIEHPSQAGPESIEAGAVPAFWRAGPNWGGVVRCRSAAIMSCGWAARPRSRLTRLRWKRRAPVRVTRPPVRESRLRKFRAHRFPDLVRPIFRAPAFTGFSKPATFRCIWGDRAILISKVLLLSIDC
jgi:hypothetical protein